MYQFSRGIYRELSPLIDSDPRCHTKVLKACEATIERLAGDRHYFANPSRTLFNDIRANFPVSAQSRVLWVVSRYLMLADRFLAEQPRNGVDANGNPLQCRAMTRRGTPCQRMPLPRNGYCPSHQHLADTEDAEAMLAA